MKTALVLFAIGFVLTGNWTQAQTAAPVLAPATAGHEPDLAFVQQHYPEAVEYRWVAREWRTGDPKGHTPRERVAVVNYDRLTMLMAQRQQNHPSEAFSANRDSTASPR
jgi:hypothetical protein